MTDAESNCFQWLEDLRVLFIEGEDEQRARFGMVLLYRMVKKNSAMFKSFARK